MGVYIKDMEMPQEKKITITIFSDGRVYENHGERLWGHGKDCIPWKAVPVPSHGRLIDADALDADLERQDMHTGEWDAVGFSIEEIENAPTIIPEEE